ncbi:hypothetical protein C9374_014185 [Naegleria lovaniensis]|uniref:Uncharacterized protein n=1 Tax=Naegleria lovaniensis TaxID=51637 RepID=A0AA88GYX4_NAELO|nr:uncharacterized protein C9374_014185 [Naegleria lovaniensis]KAG2389625.1 hypothetical protein C9374_014185 [Naegleria lovaniensis]
MNLNTEILLPSCVVTHLSLIDLQSECDSSSPHTHSIFEKFKDKMKRPLSGHIRKPFLVSNFKYQETLLIRSDNSEFFEGEIPCDVKISYQHSCILISVPESDSIQVFDHHRGLRAFRGRIRVDQIRKPTWMCVEEDFEYGTSALILCAQSHDQVSIFKFDLKLLLLQQCKHKTILNTTTTNQSMSVESNIQPIWKFGRQLLFDPQSIILSQLVKNQLFISDSGNDCLIILDTTCGQQIGTVRLLEPQSLFYAPSLGLLVPKKEFIDREYLVVSEERPTLSGVKLFERSKGNGVGEWQPIELARQIDLHNPGQMTFDSEHLFVCEPHRIQILSFEKNHFRVIGQIGNGTPGNYTDQFNSTGGICLNELEGELFVCDKHNDRVQIFK